MKKTFQKLCKDLEIPLWKGMEIGKYLRNIEERKEEFGDRIYALYEIIPSPEGDYERFIIMRNNKKDIELILKALEDTNIDFEYYKIKESKNRYTYKE